MPRREIKVRKHQRRKPHKEEKTRVHEYTRKMDTVVPRGYEKEYLRARRKFENRSARSQAQDLSLEAEETGLIDDPEHVKIWTEYPNQYDIAGVDDPYYGPQLDDLTLVRQILRDRLSKFKKSSSEIVERAKRETRKVAKSKAPAKEKKRKVGGIRKTAKRDIKKAAAKERKPLRELKEKVHRVSKAAKKWSAERKRRAGYVADTTGCSVIEADGLISRAKMKGVDYDTVDWDAMQGKDLQYDERVDRLQQQIGKTYVEGEYEAEIRAREKEWNELQAQRESEVDRVTREPYKMEEYEEPPAIY